MGLYRLKPGAGPHRLRDGRLLKAGDEIEVPKCELRNFIDKFELLSSEPEEPEPETRPMVAQSTDDGFWNVINKETSEPINDMPLSKHDAALVLQLSEAEFDELYPVPAAQPTFEPKKTPPKRGRPKKQVSNDNGNGE